MQSQYLLDTNICIYITKHQPERLRQNFEKHLPNRNILISVITLGELRFGAEKSQNRKKALKVIDEFISMVQVVELDENVADHYAQIRKDLSSRGQIIGNNDLWLAAHARANDWVMGKRQFNTVLTPECRYDMSYSASAIAALKFHGKNSSTRLIG